MPTAPEPLSDHPGEHLGEHPGDRSDDALRRLRLPGRARPAVDGTLAGGLRAWLEDGAAGIGPGGARLLVDRRALAAGAARPFPAPRRSGQWSAGALLQACARSAFRLAVTGGQAAAPFEDALAALSAGDDGPAVIAAVGSLGAADRAELRRAVAEHAAHVAADWRTVPPCWLPRTADRATVPLAGGRVVLGVVADLVLGSPPASCSSVCLLDVQASTPRPVHVQGRRLLALAETLRSGAAPLRVATYFSGTGLLTVEEVTEETLVAAVDDVLRVLATCAMPPLTRSSTGPLRATPLAGAPQPRAPAPATRVASSRPAAGATPAPRASDGRAA